MNNSIVFVLIAFLIGLLSDFFGFEIPNLEIFVTGILAFGLYGAVAGIDVEDARAQRGVIISAVTFGVAGKAVFIGGALWLMTHNSVSWLLGVMVAQIDPVAVGALLEGKSETAFSQKAQTLLRAWSSFDDPMTVLIGVYLLLPLLQGGDVTITGWFVRLAASLGFAGLVYLLHHVVKKSDAGETALLFVAIAAAVATDSLLGIALVGLFLRPKPAMDRLPTVTQWVFWAANFLLGTVAVFTSQTIVLGAALGLLAPLAQAIAVWLLTRTGYSRSDRLHLAAAQYNGMTAIALGLLFQQAGFPGMAATAAVAVVAINAVYYGANAVLALQK